ERGRGLDNEEAIVAAGATAGHAVLFSGVTVAIGLFSLVALPVPFLRSVGLGGLMIPLVAIAAAITLLPATPAPSGPALDRVRFGRAARTSSHGWGRWGGFLVRRRWTAGIGGLAAIVALAVPALSLNTGQPHTSSYPTDTPAAHALAELERQGVPSAATFP